MTNNNSLKIEKLVFGGQGFARLNGKAVFVWNALPDEEVEVEYIASKKNYAEAVAVKILTASPNRVEPKEDHFLSSAPWQMMSWDAEKSWKKKIAMETYGRQCGLVLQGAEPEIAFESECQYGYRNKIEFSFTELADGAISLAFFARGQKQRVAIAGSLLAQTVINEVAQTILAWINRNAIPIRSLKSLIIRSDNAGQAIAALFIKDRLAFADYPSLTNQLLGFHLYYSTHKSPASVPTELLASTGQDHLIVELLGAKLKYGLLSFFQINPPMFALALKDIAGFIGPKKPLVDYYCGVGAISLPLARNRAYTKLIDSNEEAIMYARENIKLNNLPNCEALCLPAEKTTELITEESIVALDPPRAGLHERLIHRILAICPPRLVYLSCDLATQARDINLLSARYKPAFLKLYNFFPRTPHIEGLCVLDRLS